MRRLLFAAIVFLIASVAVASWYDDYDAGIAAVRKGQWQLVVQKMTAAINGNSKEDNHARTYGAIFINYHPFYYRGIAYLNLGKYEQAISDFEKTSGAGEIDQGSIETLMERAKTKLAAASTPEPQPVAVQPQPQPPPVRPVPAPQPAGPSIDPALRQQVTAAINAANQSLSGARARKAGSSPQYQQAVTALAEANQRAATAKNNEELQAALGSANNAKLYADSATAPGVPQPPTTTRPAVATQIVLNDTAKRLRRALESYFSGDFDEAATQFFRLSQEMPKNGWIWAFLGASQYSQYAFEADESYRTQAMQSFRKAKQFRSWKNGLPEKYFSKRIRRVFENAG